ncbi:hypothetical protein Q8G47_29355, partial [Klebsiella pneumoniae]|uniref:hypothetical protein n=1 Tax=Klebsiella pneumoniae TaxID=573 RepID=UPI00301395F6
EPKLEEWDNTALDYQLNYMDANLNLMFGSQPPPQQQQQQQGNYQMLPWQDMFMYLQRSL